MEIAKTSFEMLWHLAHEVLENVGEMPEGAAAGAILGEFEACGISPEMFYAIAAELESAGLALQAIACFGR